MNVTEIQLCTFVPYAGAGTPDNHSIVHASFFTRNIANDQKFILKSATGLDAEGIISTFIGLTITAKTYAMKPDVRTVTMLIKLNPNHFLTQTESDLRDELYRIISFNRRSKLQMRFMDGEDQIGSLFGSITKFEASAFNADSEVQITFVCDYPFIRHTDSTDIGIPVNISTDPTGPPPEYVYSWTDDLSTASHGFTMNWRADNAYSHFNVHSIPDYDFTIDFDFIVNDRIVIASEDDDRQVYLDRPHTVGPGSDRIYLADKIRSGSTWPIMNPGANTVTSLYVGQMSGLSWRPYYWGV